MMLGVYAVNARSKHIGPIFCLTSLLQRGTIWDSFIEQLRPVIDDLLDVTCEEPTQEERDHMEAIIDLIRFEREVRTPDGPPSDAGVKTETLEEAFAVLRLFYVRGGRIKHLCRFPCCPRGKPDSVEMFAGALSNCLYDKMPDLPALNKWMRQFHPCVFHLIGFSFGTSPEMFFRSQGRRQGSSQYEFQVDHLIGPSEDSVVKAINVSRNRKSNKYLQNQPESWDNLCIVTLLFRVVMETLYTTFSLASTHTEPNFISFIDPTTGPPTKLAERIFELLVDLDSTFWILVRRSSSGDWTDEKVGKVFDFATTLLGHIILRMIEPWELWPWPFRFMGDPGISDAVQQGVLHRFANTCGWCREECLAEPLFVASGGKPGVLSLTAQYPDVRRVIRMMKRAKPSNQGSEWRFSRFG